MIPRPRLLLCLLHAMLAWSGVASTCHAESHIDRPVQRGPSYVFAGGGFGALPGGSGTGYTLGLLLRPLRASDLVPASFAWNTGLLLGVDVQSAGAGTKLVSGDLVLRHYLRDMRVEPGGRSGYLGVGVGLSTLSAPAGGGNGFSVLLQVGLEREVKWKLVVLLGAQYRLYRIAGQDDGTWSAKAGLALPVSF